MFWQAEKNISAKMISLIFLLHNFSTQCYYGISPKHVWSFKCVTVLLVYSVCFPGLKPCKWLSENIQNLKNNFERLKSNTTSADMLNEVLNC